MLDCNGNIEIIVVVIVIIIDDDDDDGVLVSEADERHGNPPQGNQEY